MNPPILALGLDVGRKRIGVAGCDRLGIVARGITTIARQSWQQDMERLKAIVREREADTLIVGLPYNMDGSLGYQARHVQKFARDAAKHLGLKLEYVDERLSSVEAEQLMHQARISPRQDKASVDRIAAALILQRWLEQQHPDTRK